MYRPASVGSSSCHGRSSGCSAAASHLPLESRGPSSGHSRRSKETSPWPTGRQPVQLIARRSLDTSSTPPERRMLASSNWWLRGSLLLIYCLAAAAAGPRQHETCGLHLAPAAGSLHDLLLLFLQLRRLLSTSSASSARLRRLRGMASTRMLPPPPRPHARVWAARESERR